MLLIVDLTVNKKLQMYFPFLLAYFKKKGFDYKIVKSIKDVANINEKNVTGVVISGSPMRLSHKIDIKDINVALYCHLMFDVPTLGICFGCQLLNMIYGGSVKPFGRLVCEKHPVRLVRQVTEGCPVQFCFNDMLDKIGYGFKVMSETQVDGRKVVCHIEKDNIIGYLFHPELDFDNCGHLERYINIIKNVSIK
jgi:GMP synthase-like glutamine amidotransferase